MRASRQDVCLKLNLSSQRDAEDTDLGQARGLCFGLSIWMTSWRFREMDTPWWDDRVTVQ